MQIENCIVFLVADWQIMWVVEARSDSDVVELEYLLANTL